MRCQFNVIGFWSPALTQQDLRKRVCERHPVHTSRRKATFGARLAIFHTMAKTYLDLADNWATAHRDVLEEAGQHWLKHKSWLTVMQLGRSALRRETGVNVFQALRELPPPLGRVEHPEDRVILRVRALAYLPELRPVLDGFVQALVLSAGKLKDEHDESPTLRNTDLTMVLGLSRDISDRISQLLLDENWMFGGGSGSPGGTWERNITETTLPLLKVNSLEDYLTAEGERFWNRAAELDLLPSHPLAVVEAEQPAAGKALWVQELHPAIANAADQLLAGAHFDAAVRAGAIAFRDFLRERSGVHNLDGAQLAGAALGGSAPPLVLADIGNQDGKREQDGWRMLAEGCFAAIRNPVAHRHIYDDRNAAVEALVVMSLVARRVDAASGLSGEETTPDERPGA